MSKLLIRITTVMILIFIAWGISQIIKNFIGIYQGLWVKIGATIFLKRECFQELLGQPWVFEVLSLMYLSLVYPFVPVK